jgi:hypothetical protein
MAPNNIKLVSPVRNSLEDNGIHRLKRHYLEGSRLKMYQKMLNVYIRSEVLTAVVIKSSTCRVTTPRKKIKTGKVVPALN